MPSCDTCGHNNYDEVYDSYYCDADIDEDEVARLAMRNSIVKGKNAYDCPFYSHYDEYSVVKHQI